MRIKRQEQHTEIHETAFRKHRGLFVTAAVIVVMIVLAVTVTSAARVVRGGEITISAGDGTITIAQKLEKKGMIHSPDLFRAMAYLSRTDGDWREGTYRISRGESCFALFHQMTDPLKGEVRVTIPEGKQVKEIAAILDRAGVCGSDEFMNACENHRFSNSFLKGVDTSGRISGLEGYLFPDTYYFEKDSDPDAVISKMLDRFGEKVYTKKIRAAAKKQGLTVDQTVILASMVESEATTKADRRLVAGVFLVRLRSTSGWKLQSCVTVEYAKGIKKAVISYDDTQYDSPYNTYLHAGLPYGPICCPGMESIDAVLYPKKSTYRYFVSDGKGKLYFASTYEQHLANSRKLYS